MLTMRRFLVFSFLSFTQVLFLSFEAKSQTFLTNVEINLCPEYQYGGVVLEVYHTLGSDPTLRSLDIVSQTIGTTTASLVVRFPSTLASTPFNIISSCRNAVGFSPPSNIVSVSNCNVLARIDTDGDGVANNLEDSNCDNSFAFGDQSNPNSSDSDGDGARDFEEFSSFTSPLSAGSSPRPYVFTSAPFDPDGDGNSNPVVWRKPGGVWFVRDVGQVGSHQSFQFGLLGDVPFAYKPEDTVSDIGVIRALGSQYLWIFRGAGFKRSNGQLQTLLGFGAVGDHIIPGPWETVGVTSPAIARQTDGVWTFFIFLKNGLFKIVQIGQNEDLPRPQDYDGDGLFDVAVFRPSNQTTYLIRSSNQVAESYQFGTTTSIFRVLGDYSGDGISEISFWEPTLGKFSSLLSDNGFDSVAATTQDPNYYFEMELGQNNVHVPLNWNRQNGRLLYTVVDHATGVRSFKENNQPSNGVTSVQWGLAGDHHG
jgi:hypothetical protein